MTGRHRVPDVVGGLHLHRLVERLDRVRVLKFWMTPWLTRTSAITNEIGSRMRSRRADEVDPEVAERAAGPAGQAADQGDDDRTCPTAADTKFCTVSPAIWVRWLIVDSPDVVLPVRVGHEADGGVERHLRVDVGQVVGLSGSQVWNRWKQ